MLGISEILIILVLLMIPSLIALADILKNKFPQNDKLIWTIVVIFVPLIGTVLYYLIGRKLKIKE